MGSQLLLGVSAWSFLPLVATALLLFVAWGAVGLVVGATRRDGGQAIAWTTALIAGSFVLNHLAQLWTPLSRWRPLSLFRYYQPEVILASGVPASTIVVLAVTIVAGVAIGIAMMQRRDL